MGLRATEPANGPVNSMDKQKSFSLLLPQKPQMAGGDSNYFKVSLRGRLGDSARAREGAKGTCSRRARRPEVHP